MGSMAGHDTGYKRLFSNHEMVADLLTGFVREPWVAEVELDTLERVNASYVSDDLREREDDLVWRVRWRDHWLYVYLLLEFQSTVDRFMALRMLVYVGLLYQDLVRAKEFTPGGLLPPVLPIVREP
jgi:predicted transposase YdaD